MAGKHRRRERVILATKVFHKMGNDPNDCGLSRRYIIKALDASLKRLDTDYDEIWRQLPLGTRFPYNR